MNNEPKMRAGAISVEGLRGENQMNISDCFMDPCISVVSAQRTNHQR